MAATNTSVDLTCPCMYCKNIAAGKNSYVMYKAKGKDHTVGPFTPEEAQVQADDIKGFEDVTNVVIKKIGG